MIVVEKSTWVERLVWNDIMTLKRCVSLLFSFSFIVAFKIYVGRDENVVYRKLKV